ncbi:unnamed protein product [Rhizopus stolonifer]
MEITDECRDAILQFARYCPNVTKIKGSEKNIWSILAQLSTRYFEKLKELPVPKKGDMAEYSACALIYRNQLKTHHVIGYSASSAYGSFENLQLRKFTNIQTLQIFPDKDNARIYDFDEVIDACPQITCLSIRIEELFSVNTLSKNLTRRTSIKNHQSVINLNADINFDRHAIDYLLHKFPNMKKGFLRINNICLPNTKEEVEYFTTNFRKLVDYTYTKDFSINLQTSLEPLMEIIQYVGTKSLRVFFTLDDEDGPLDGIRLMFKKDHISLDCKNGISRRGLLMIWHAFSTSVTRLEVRRHSLFIDDDANIIITDILPNMNLIELHYSRSSRVCLPIETVVSSPDYSLKSLYLEVFDVDKNVYSYLSSNCKQLTKLKIHLSDVWDQKRYTICMSCTRFELFDFRTDIYTVVKNAEILLIVQANSDKKTQYILTKGELRKVGYKESIQRSVDFTIELVCCSIDYISLDIGYAKIYNYPIHLK